MGACNNGMITKQYQRTKFTFYVLNIILVSVKSSGI